MKTSALLAILFPVWLGATVAQDPGWPRQITKHGNTLVYYQPQVDEWNNFAEISWRMAFSLTPAGGKEVVGVVDAQGHTQIDTDNKVVLISSITITGTRFPSKDQANAAQMDQLAEPPFLCDSLVATRPRSRR